MSSRPFWLHSDSLPQRGKKKKTRKKTKAQRYKHMGIINVDFDLVLNQSTVVFKTHTDRFWQVCSVNSKTA